MLVEGFENLTLLGSGGFSRVYRAFQPRFGRNVAIKVLQFDVADESAIRSFERESRAMGRVSAHPNIVTVFDNGITDDGRLYIVMEYLEGGTYSDRFSHGPIAVEELLQVGVKVCSALATAHQHDILHRDLKPENIFISKYGAPAIGDFGISTIDRERTSTGTSGLTIHFAPPEVIDGNPTSVQSDIYSLGATFWAMLSGVKPFYSQTDQSIVTTAVRILSQEPGPLERGDSPTGLEELIVEMMAKNPNQRPSEAIEVAERMQEIQQTLGLPPTPTAYRRTSTDLSGSSTVATGQEDPDDSLLATNEHRHEPNWPSNTPSVTSAEDNSGAQPAGQGMASDESRELRSSGIDSEAEAIPEPGTTMPPSGTSASTAGQPISARPPMTGDPTQPAPTPLSEGLDRTVLSPMAAPTVPRGEPSGGPWEQAADSNTDGDKLTDTSPRSTSAPPTHQRRTRRQTAILTMASGGVAILVTLVLWMAGAFAPGTESDDGPAATTETTAIPTTDTSTTTTAPTTTTAATIAVVPVDLEAGACTDSPNGATVELIDCSESHLYELFATNDISGLFSSYSAGTPYPTETVQADGEGALWLDYDAWESCENALKDYVGSNSGDANFHHHYLYPDEAAWLDGDRMVYCWLYLTDGTTNAPIPSDQSWKDSAS